MPGSYTGSPAATMNSLGNLQVFARSGNGHLQHGYSSSGPWNGPQDLGNAAITH